MRRLATARRRDSRYTMLKKRIIPKLLIKTQLIGGRPRPVLVTTRSFRGTVRVGSPSSQARIYEANLADELAVLNIDDEPIAAAAATLDLVQELASETFMPLTVGGGVRKADDFGLLLDRGADRIAVNTSAVESPALITEAATRYGAQCVVLSIDFRTTADGTVRVVTRRGTATTEFDVVAWAREGVSRGCGQILLCDADRDGTGNGLNIEIGRAVAEAVSVPVILSGGCGVADHFVQGFRDAGADGVAAGTIFCLRDQTPMQVRAHVRNAGIPIRMETF